VDIDLVYTWVNPHDPLWKAKRQQYAVGEVKDDELYSNGELRYSDHGELAYSLQTVARHLPFVRHIYIAHAGSPASWLETRPNWLRDREKIILIKQEDLLPFEIAPSFQSDVIECFLCKIPGLSEHYLYSNDDFFFSRRHTPADFFTNDGRCIVGVCELFAGMSAEDGPFEACETNSVRALLRRLRLPAHIPVGTKRLSKALNHPRLQLRALLRGMRLLNTPTHVTQAYRKSRWDGFHQIFQEEITDLCSRRFRSRHDFIINMMYHHYLRSMKEAHFYYEPHHAYLERSQPLEDRERFRDALLAQQSQISRFCLNDDVSLGNDGWASFISSLMDRLGYPVVLNHPLIPLEQVAR
jgi:hypothetical protein